MPASIDPVEEPSSVNQRKRLIPVLVPGLIAFSMGQTVLFAIAGPVFRDIGLSESQLGTIISAAAALFVISSGVWGAIADHWGRRPTIVFGLVSYGITSLAFIGVLHQGLSGSLAAGTVFTSLLVLRLLYAAFGAGIQPASVALMADVSAEKERASAVAIVGAAFGIGMVLGPATAALLVGFTVLTPLYVIAMLGLASAYLAWRYLPKQESIAKDTAKSEALPFNQLSFLLAAALLVYTAMSSIQQTLAFNLQDITGASSVDTARLTGFCFMAIAIATLLVQGGLIQAFKPQPTTLLILALPTLLISLFVYGLADNFLMLLAASALMGVGFGCAMPGLMSAASVLAGDQEQGRVAGLMQATMSAGFVVGPYTGTSLYEVNRLYAAWFSLGAVALAAVCICIWLVQYRSRIQTLKVS